MALKADIPLQGDMTHSNGYIRVTDARLFKKDNTTTSKVDPDDFTKTIDVTGSEWFLMVDVAVYKDSDERAKVGAKTIPCPSIDRFKYAYSVGDESGSNLIAHAYAKLKTESVLDGASDV